MYLGIFVDVLNKIFYYFGSQIILGLKCKIRVSQETGMTLFFTPYLSSVKWELLLSSFSFMCIPF